MALCITGWLEDRLETVYKKDERFSDKASSLFTLDLGAPEKLPDNLRGERWSFVQLPLATLQEELKLVDQVASIDCTSDVHPLNHYSRL